VDVYPWLRAALFKLDPERAHEVVFGILKISAHHPGLLRAMHWGFGVDDPRLHSNQFGLHFPNPVGLAAGFDKDGEAAAAWWALGFGSAELGTVTALAQPGNPKPRLHRIPEARAIINRMGFNNHGAAALRARLERDRGEAYFPSMPIAVNVGKSRAVDVKDAAADYHASLLAVWPVADLVVLNVSSPNTPGLRALQGAGALAELLQLAASVSADQGEKPLLVKIAPDLDEHGLDEVVAACEAHGVAGLIATNTTVRRDMLASDPQLEGGLSGAPLSALARNTLLALRARTRLPLVSVGGIDSAAEARARFEAGASLIQLYTGWIYQGPMLTRRIAQGLSSWLAGEGYASLNAYLHARDRESDNHGAAESA